MSFFGTMMGNLAARAVLPLLALGGYGAYKVGALDEIEIPGIAKGPSHYEMQARITDVSNSCRLRFRQDGKLRQTEALDCQRAVSMLKQPTFANYSIHKSESVTYTYYSMDGTETLVGTMTGNSDANGRPYRRNDVINIRVSTKDPSNSEVI